MPRARRRCGELACRARGGGSTSFVGANVALRNMPQSAREHAHQRRGAMSLRDSSRAVARGVQGHAVLRRRGGRQCHCGRQRCRRALPRCARADDLGIRCVQSLGGATSGSNPGGGGAGGTILVASEAPLIGGRGLDARGGGVTEPRAPIPDSVGNGGEGRVRVHCADQSCPVVALPAAMVLPL